MLERKQLIFFTIKYFPKYVLQEIRYYRRGPYQLFVKSLFKSLKIFKSVSIVPKPNSESYLIEINFLMTAVNIHFHFTLSVPER